MVYTSSIYLISLLVASAAAHMSITFPPPFRGKTNPLATNVNFDINSPISAAKWPCSGESGPSATTLTAGEKSKITFSSGAMHGGGSCQVALSYDGQKTFYVIHSWQGNCPNGPESSLDFTVPADAKAGEATFIWTWFNKIGNREVYANCAGVTIKAGSGGSASVPFESRPDLFVANLGNGCSVPDGKDVTFPNPGPDVTGTGNAEVSGCQPINGIGNSARGSGSGGGNTPQPVPSQALPVSSQAPPASSTVPVNTAIPPVARPSGSVPNPPTSSTPVESGNLPLSPDGTCGTKYRCSPGNCCSKAGFCGNSELHCAGTKPEPLVARFEVVRNRTSAIPPCNEPIATAPLIDIPAYTPRPTPFPVGTAPNPIGTAPYGTAPIGTGTIGAPAPTGTSPSLALPESPDGTCGDKYRCGAGSCCSSAGFCGLSVLHCGTGCQAQFGKCGPGAKRWIAGGHGRWKTMLN